MKNIQLFLAVLAVVFVFSACEKSDIKPQCFTNEAAQPASQVSDQSAKERTRTTGLPEGGIVVPGGPVKDIVGSGDDDRDGGDKKSKAPGR